MPGITLAALCVIGQVHTYPIVSVRPVWPEVASVGQAVRLEYEVTVRKVSPNGEFFRNMTVRLPLPPPPGVMKLIINECEAAS